MNGRSSLAFVCVCLAALVVGFPTPSPAQEAAPPGQARGGLVNPANPPAQRLGQGVASPGEVQRLFDAYTVMQAQQVLALSDDKFGVFLPRLRALQQTRRKHDQKRQQLVARLGRLANAEPPEDARITEALKELAALDDGHASEMRQAYDALDDTLDLRQRARFRLFEQQMERRKFDLIMRARENRR